MFFRSVCVLTGLFAVSFLVGGVPVTAQQASPAPRTAVAVRASFGEAVRNLPAYLASETREDYSNALENATGAERDSTLPDLLHWLDDERPKVRSLALLSVYILYLPSENRQERPFSSSLPVRYIPVVAARLLDPDPAVRNAAFGAVQSTMYTTAGLNELVKLIVPMLGEPDVLTEYPDPSFVEGRERLLAGMAPEQRAQFKAMPYKIIRLPAVGTQMCWILARPGRQPSDVVDDAMIAFLDRKDQTKSTLGDCLHNLALGSASERINDEALRRVFDQKAMTIFLLQFVPRMRLSPAQLVVQKDRLIALSNDESAHPALRRAARDVATCWNEQPTGRCGPSDKDLSEQSDTR